MRAPSNSRLSGNPELQSSGADRSPAKALVAAVLAGAQDDLKLSGPLAAQARQWFEEQDPTRAWSFEWCCRVLDLDPNILRQQLADDARRGELHQR